MDDARLTILEKQFAEQNKLLQEVRDSQLKVASALLGNLESGSIGLIEEVRTLRRETEALRILVNTQAITISKHEETLINLKAFQRDIKKLVGFFAVAIPICVEILKGVFIVAWAYCKKKMGE